MRKNVETYEEGNEDERGKVRKVIRKKRKVMRNVIRKMRKMLR